MMRILSLSVALLVLQASVAVRVADSLAETWDSANLEIHKAPRVSLLVKKQSSPNLKREILLLVAPPAGGKGTQAERIAEKMHIPHLSTGDMLRGEVAKGTDIGKQAQQTMAGGGLATDDLVVKIVKSRISEEDCQHGFILDGFPRTLPQARALDAMLQESGEEIGRIIDLEVPDEVVVKRITGRWTHKPLGRSYHVLWKPPKSLGDKQMSAETMLDDVTGEPLTQRRDDMAEAAKSRLAKYYQETQPILSHYKGRGKENHIKTINGDQDIDDVTSDIFKSLEPPADKTDPASVPSSCAEAVPNSVARMTRWWHVWNTCKCPGGTKLTGSHALCKAYYRKFDPYTVAGLGCVCE